VGFGSHGIEGIGDKHVTWIHNVLATDLLVCVDDMSCIRGLQLLQEGSESLRDHLGLDPQWLASIDGVFGISGVCNILAAIQTAKHLGLGEDDPIYTVATDGFDRYPSVMRRLDGQEGEQTDAVARDRMGIFREQSPQMVLDGSPEVQRRWHNQKYFTWVEQQGMDVSQLNALSDQNFWAAEAAKVPELDAATLALRE
jgi:cysteine synthase A